MFDFMTMEEINVLKERCKAGNIFWRDNDGRCTRVLRVDLEWVEFEDEPELVEPAAMLEKTVPVALFNEVSSAFFEMTPLFG